MKKITFKACSIKATKIEKSKLLQQIKGGQGDPPPPSGMATAND